MKVAYISGPIGHPGEIGWERVRINCQEAFSVGLEALRLGVAPIVPHWGGLRKDTFKIKWEKWIEADLEIIKRCDLVLRCQGESKGADLECEEAKRLGIQVIEAGPWNWHNEAKLWLKYGCLPIPADESLKA